MRRLISGVLAAILLLSTVSAKPVGSAPILIDGVRPGSSPSRGELLSKGFKLDPGDNREGYGGWTNGRTKVVVNVARVVEVVGERVTFSDGKSITLGDSMEKAQKTINSSELHVDYQVPNTIIRATAKADEKSTVGLVVFAKQGKVFRLDAVVRKVQFGKEQFW